MRNEKGKKRKKKKREKEIELILLSSFVLFLFYLEYRVEHVYRYDVIKREIAHRFNCKRQNSSVLSS